jgi:hypothetical protein
MSQQKWNKFCKSQICLVWLHAACYKTEILEPFCENITWFVSTEYFVDFIQPLVRKLNKLAGLNFTTFINSGWRASKFQLYILNFPLPWWSYLQTLTVYIRSFYCNSSPLRMHTHTNTNAHTHNTQNNYQLLDFGFLLNQNRIKTD